MTRAAPFAPDPEERALADGLFAAVRDMAPDREGVSRPAFSQVETRVLEHLAGVAERAGLATTWDAGGNVVMSLPEDRDADRYVLVGSHVDSVPMGGNYDGLAGVLAGLFCLLRARRCGTRFARPVRVIAMRGEESAWFGPCYIASKALLGTLATAELDATHRDDGRTLADHMADVGIDMEPVRAGRPLLDRSEVLEYLELHIEQGPLLVGKDSPAAIVSAIRGNLRHRAVRCIGEAGHSGAVPRAFRRDPVLAMADLLTRLDESWLTILQKGDDLVLTAGMVGTDPERHALSRIPDAVTFSLDIRSQDPGVLTSMAGLLAEEMAEVVRQRGVRFEPDAAHETAPALMDPGLVAALAAAMERIGLPPMVMASGGGHDAAVFANAGVPTAMVFVRNRNGSHNPEEAMETDDFLAGLSILHEHLMTPAPKDARDAD